MAICVVASSALALGAIQDERVDPIREELSKEVGAYHQAINQAEAELQAALDAQVAGIGSQLPMEERLERERNLKQQFQAIKQEGTEPQDDNIKKAANKFREAIVTASSRCFDAHTEAAKKLGQLNNPGEAAAILEERGRFLDARYPWVARLRAQLLEWLPIDATIRCSRTRNNGRTETVTGRVVENDGYQVVVEAPGLSGPYRLWRFKVEASGTLRLCEQVKKDPKQVGVVIRNCSGCLKVDGGGISGDYSWEVEHPNGRLEKVTGTLTWDVIKRSS